MKSSSQSASASYAPSYAAGYASGYAFGEPIPAPEVIDEDPAAGWILWDETVSEGDFQHEMRYAPTGPAPLRALGCILLNFAELS